MLLGPLDAVAYGVGLLVGVWQGELPAGEKGAEVLLLPNCTGILVVERGFWHSQRPLPSSPLDLCLWVWERERGIVRSLYQGTSGIITEPGGKGQRTLCCVGCVAQAASV